MAPFVFQRTSHIELLQKIYNLFPNAKYFGIYDFAKPVFVIRDPELISTITIKKFDNFCDRNSFANKILDPMASKNLSDLKGDHWREMRKLLSPSFTSSKMKMMFELISQCAENFVDFVTTQSGKTGKTYDMKDILGRYATDTVATCAFGISVDSFKHPNNEFFLLAKKALTFDKWLVFKFFLHRNFSLLARLLNLRMFGPEIEKFFKDIVSNTVKVRDEQGIVRPDMIQLMMETRNKDSGPEFDIDEMTAQAFVFFLAGFDTTSTAMSFMTHVLAVNPDIQSKLREEIDDVLRQTNGKPTYEAINHMKYLDAVVNETLRLYTPASFLDRKCVKETKLPAATSDGEPITMKPGDNIWVPVFSLHRDPKYYPQPEKFDPERFLKGDVDNLVFIPFGIGPRMCIGNRFALMEAKVMLVYLLSRCDLEPDVKTRIPMVLAKSAVMMPDNGFWLKLRARESKTRIKVVLRLHQPTRRVPWTTPLYCRGCRSSNNRRGVARARDRGAGQAADDPEAVLQGRTQPYDLLKWSGSYFRALADGEEPSVKPRLEYPSSSTASGYCCGSLDVREWPPRRQGFDRDYNKTLPVETISRRWDCLCLDRRDLDTILAIGRFRRTCQVKKFLAIAVGLLGASLTETMIMVCQLFSHEPDGGSAMIPLTLFMEIYEYLAGLACDGNDEKDTLEQNITERTACKDGSSVDRTCSINSQDTDVDINSELISKDEVDLSKTDLSELIDNSSLEREATNYEEKRDESSTSPKGDALTGKDRADYDVTIGRKFCGVKDANDESLSSEIEKATKVTCYPNVPAERVASVTAWMLECARLQEGMVGPRNIRHTSCPLLHERSTSK
ncbi:Cytochrome P450 9e2 [Temnothorax longispinosus]|uniref:Cytochrome P450 9e2 n=1 Tax=Temnothorax longispinosus TaxID=300112 RepID=A0A4S2JCU6_9HYME|nr:Cytochrome P450 9e2 [Temnothorax longispinosus]